MEATVDFFNQFGMALLAIVVPLAIAGLKALWPKIPPRLIPLVAVVLGSGGDLLMSFVNDWVGMHHPASPALAAIMGLAGVGVRELVVQARKAWQTYQDGGGGGGTTTLCIAALACLLMSLTACGPRAPEITNPNIYTRLGQAEAELTSLAESFGQMKAAGLAPAGSAVRATGERILRTASDALDAAEAAVAQGEMVTAEDYLRATQNALTQIRTLLERKDDHVGSLERGGAEGRRSWIGAYAVHADRPVARPALERAHDGAGRSRQPGDGGWPGVRAGGSAAHDRAA